MKIDAFEVLRMVDFGDAPVLPADAARSHAAIEATVGQVLAAGAIPIVLGGDHSIAEPDIRACAAKHGPVGLVHFDTHTDTGTQGLRRRGLARHADYRLVEEGSIDPKRYVQIGLRGDWPGTTEFGWQMRRGSRASSRTTSATGASGRSCGKRWRSSAPARLPVDRRRRPRPGLCSGNGDSRARWAHVDELLWAARTVAAGIELVGADVVEVIPTAVGSADVTALVAERTVREVMTGIALARAEE